MNRRARPVIRAFAAALVLAMASAPAMAASPLSGLFGNVRMSRVTGDLGGVEIEIHADDPRPWALIVICEGWCNAAYRVPVALTDASLSFDYVETPAYSDGAPASPTRQRYRLALRGKRLLLRADGVEEEPVYLQRLSRRFGLAVADPPADRP